MDNYVDSEIPGLAAWFCYNITMKKNPPIFIVRGAPSTGKTEFAKLLMDKLDWNIIPRCFSVAGLVDINDFWVLENVERLCPEGTYLDDRAYKAVEYAWLRGEMRHCLNWANGPLIVVGCFIREKELRPFFNLAKRLERKVFLAACRGVDFPWDENARPIRQLERNANGVPIRVAGRMSAAFEFTDGTEPWETGVLAYDEVVVSNDYLSQERASDELVSKFIELYGLDKT